VIFAAPAYERAAPPEKLAGNALSLGFRSRIGKSVKDAMDMAALTASATSGKTLVVISGSFYTIGEAKKILGQECNSPALAGLR